MLARDKHSSGMRRKQRTVGVVAGGGVRGVVVVAALAFVALVGGAWAAKSFGVVIDAGSTGSRIHVFSWPKREGEALPKDITVPIEFATEDCPDPITDPAGITELDGLLAFAKSHVRGEAWGRGRAGGTRERATARAARRSPSREGRCRRRRCS